MAQRDETNYRTNSTSVLLLLALTPAIALFAMTAASAAPLAPTAATGQQKAAGQTVVPAPTAHITLGSANGTAGSQVTVAISLTKNGPNMVTIAPLKVSFDPSLLTFGTCTKTAALSAGKAVNSAMPSAGEVSLVLSGDLEAIPDGEIIDCTFTIAADAASGVTALSFESAAMADDEFNDYDATGSSGAVTLGDGMPSTPTTTPLVLTTPTPTNTPKSCVGDCSDDAQVTVNELIQMVNIALGNADPSTCAAGDTNGDHEITVNEIVAGVSNALNGCP